MATQAAAALVQIHGIAACVASIGELGQLATALARTSERMRDDGLPADATKYLHAIGEQLSDCESHLEDVIVWASRVRCSLSELGLHALAKSVLPFTHLRITPPE